MLGSCLVCLGLNSPLPVTGLLYQFTGEKHNLNHYRHTERGLEVRTIRTGKYWCTGSPGLWLVTLESHLSAKACLWQQCLLGITTVGLPACLFLTLCIGPWHARSAAASDSFSGHVHHFQHQCSNFWEAAIVKECLYCLAFCAEVNSSHCLWLSELAWALAVFLTLQCQVVTICTAGWTLCYSTFCPHSVFICFVWIWEQTAIVSLYSINWLIFITEI